MESRVMFGKASFSEFRNPRLLDENNMVVLFKSELESSFMGGWAPGHIYLEDPQLWERFVISR